MYADDNLAARVTILHISDRLCRFAQAETAIDYGFNFTFRHEGAESVEILLVEFGHEAGKLLAHKRRHHERWDQPRENTKHRSVKAQHAGADVNAVRGQGVPQL